MALPFFGTGMKTDLVQGTAISPSVAEINTTGRHLALFALIAIGEKSLEVDMEKGGTFSKLVFTEVSCIF